MAGGAGPGRGIVPEGHYHRNHQVNHNLPFKYNCECNHTHQKTPILLRLPIVSMIWIAALVKPVPALFQAKGTGGVALHVTKGAFLLIEHIPVSICAIYLVDVWCGKILNTGFGVIVDQGGNTVHPKVVWVETVILWVAVQGELGLE